MQRGWGNRSCSNWYRDAFKGTMQPPLVLQGSNQEDITRLFIVLCGERATAKGPKLKREVSDWIK